MILRFIDGMHLSEFALRDFINIEPFMADTGVIVIDDVLPRNGLEAARDRKTEPWTRRRVQGDRDPASGTSRSGGFVDQHGTDGHGRVVVGVDQASMILKDSYAAEEHYLLQPDPQTPPQEYLDRSIATGAGRAACVCRSGSQLVAVRESSILSRPPMVCGMSYAVLASRGPDRFRELPRSVPKPVRWRLRVRSSDEP